MRITVIGARGQVARALAERSGPHLSIRLLGRPALDLEKVIDAQSCIAATMPDVIVNAAAHTDVEGAERAPAGAFRVNATGAGVVAAAAARLKVPLIHLSTEYVFDGTKTEPYTEADPTVPLNAYGYSKLAGEVAVAAMTDNYAILRTSWLYSSNGWNFLTKIRAAGGTSAEVNVVADRSGSPTSVFELAAGIEQVARNLVIAGCGGHGRGVFHMTCAGVTTWAGFATAILEHSADNGSTWPVVRPIPSSDIRELARRPANSRLNNDQLKRVHGIVLADWKEALLGVMNRLDEGPFAKPACVQPGNPPGILSLTPS